MSQIPGAVMHAYSEIAHDFVHEIPQSISNSADAAFEDAKDRYETLIMRLTRQHPPLQCVLID